MMIPGNCPLFSGMTADDTVHLLECLDGSQKKYRKGDTILREGSEVDSIGLVLAGFVQIVRLDFDGNRLIQAGMGPGAIFAESFVFAGMRRAPVSVVAGEDSIVLFLSFQKMFQPCGRMCSFHQKLVENMLNLLARKNLLLSGRMDVVSKRSIREKIIAYISQEARAQQTDVPLVPYNRQELADYLCVDRSALSRELGNLKREGVLSVEGNRFRLFH